MSKITLKDIRLSEYTLENLTGISELRDEMLKRRQQLVKISDICSRIPAKPAGSFREIQQFLKQKLLTPFLPTKPF